jgi:hypothetical protein
MVGRMLRFTPNGWSVSSLHRMISRLRSFGMDWVSAVMNPSPPALATAGDQVRRGRPSAAVQHDRVPDSERFGEAGREPVL